VAEGEARHDDCEDSRRVDLLGDEVGDERGEQRERDVGEGVVGGPAQPEDRRGDRGPEVLIAAA
jgi:hypothetical protein